MLGPLLKTSPQTRVLESPNWHRDWETSEKRKNGKRNYTKGKVNKQKRAAFLANIRLELEGRKWSKTFFKMTET